MKKEYQNMSLIDLLNERNFFEDQLTISEKESKEYYHFKSKIRVIEAEISVKESEAKWKRPN